MTITKHVYAYFEDSTSKIGKTGLADVAFYIKSVKHSDSAIAVVVNGTVGFEVGYGIYGIQVAGMDLETYDYVGAAQTASTAVSSKSVPMLRWDAAESHDTELSNLDASVSSRSTLSESDIRSSVGLSADNLDTQLSTISAKTNNLPSDPADQSLVDAAISAISVPSVSDIDTQLSSTHGTGLWGGASGSITYVYNVTNSISGEPLEGVKVTVYSDSGLTNIVATGTTDNFGNTTFYLDAGTYYFVSVKSGYEFTNPDIEAVS